MFCKHEGKVSQQFWNYWLKQTEKKHPLHIIFFKKCFFFFLNSQQSPSWLDFNGCNIDNIYGVPFINFCLERESKKQMKK